MSSKLVNYIEAVFIVSVTLLLVFLVFNNSGIDYIPEFENYKEKGVVTKVIDGDTVIVEGDRVRLAGIDTDEKNYPCYQDAKRRMESLVLGREVHLEKALENKDQYGRLLRYLIINDTNVNLKMVREGMAVARFSGECKYRSEIEEAERKARENSRGCKWGSKDWTMDSNTHEGSENETQDKYGNYTDPCDASDMIGEEAKIVGEIVDAGKTEEALFLNFGAPYPDSCFSAVIFKENMDIFSDSTRFYKGKKALVTGKVEEYKGKPEIILESESQLEFVN